MAQESDHWNRFWTSDPSGDEALGGEAQRRRIADWWREFFSEEGLGAAPRILDLASGASPSLRLADEVLRKAGLNPHFTCLDYAPAALEAVRRLLPGAETVVGDALDPPFPPQSFDLVTSQFGVEYAGLAAIEKAFGFVAPAGRFGAILHYKAGGIDAECGANADAVDSFLALGLLGAAETALRRSYDNATRGARPDAEAEAALLAAAERGKALIAQLAPSAGADLVVRVFNDLGQLSARRFYHDPADAFGWLDGIGAELCGYRDRLRAMQGAALEENEIETLRTIAAAMNFKTFEAAPLHFGEAALPGAWALIARR